MAFEYFEEAEVNISQLDAGPPVGEFGVRIYSDELSKSLPVAQDIKVFLEGREISRSNGTKSKIESVRISGTESVFRYNGRRYMELGANFTDTDTSALVIATRKIVEKEFDDKRLERYGINSDSLEYDFGTESNNQKSFKSMQLAFPVLLFAMYIMLVWQFKSSLQPLLIFMAIPFSLFGVTAGLYYTNNPLSFFVMLGLFALVGISVNNTILLVDYANQARTTGLSRIESVGAAMLERFRPLITTSLTSVVALIPLALSDPFWESLAVTLIFGLLTSTLLVIVAFPYYYLFGELLRQYIRPHHFISWLIIAMVLIFAIGSLLGGYAVLAAFVAYILATIYYAKMRRG